MPTRKYRSDKNQLLAKGKIIVNPTEDAKYQPKIEIVDLIDAIRALQICQK